MRIDITNHIHAATREVVRREHNGAPAWVLTVTRRYETDIDDLWDAVTNAGRLPRWFLPISGDLRLGGRYQLEGNAGGQITGCEPPSMLAVTWEYGGQVSWVTVALMSEGARRTRLTLEHVAHVPEALWAEYGPGATGVGWDLGLMGLAMHLASGEAVDPKAVEAWSVSDEGRAATAAISAAWEAASVAAGTDPSAARAAADRTTAFYSGMPG